MERSKKDKALIERIYKTYRQQLWYCAARYLNEYDAEDVVQEVMTEMLDRLDNIRDRSEPEIRAYLLTITKNRCVDILRKSSVRKSTSLEAIEEEIGAFWKTEMGLPEDVVIGRDLARVLSKGFQKLSPEYRIVMEYRIQENMSSKEIARRTQLTPTTVDKRLSRARKELRQMLKRVGYNV